MPAGFVFVSLIGAYVGLGLLERSIAILIFSAAWLGLAHLFVVLHEERSLEARFGASYEEYRRRVPRWLPRPT